MSSLIKKITIIGGGSAGWLTAAVIAAEYLVGDQSGIEITLIESDNVMALGVGEGTWPSMRGTLKKIGLSEKEVILECDASFKQGSKFSNWKSGNGDVYFHPFSLPTGYSTFDIVPYWYNYQNTLSFADAVCVQSRLDEKNLAPKQASTEEYAFNVNYGYHLDATKFVRLLQKYCTNKLGVRHVVDHVTAVNSADNGDIDSVTTKTNGDIRGDLFIDCSGAASILLGKHYKIPLVSKKSVLFNDTALAAQVPYEAENSPISSFTLSTAQTAGWIWDIGLSSRRGVGHTYSGGHISDEAAEVQLRKYIASTTNENIAETVAVRKISISPGYREKFWHRNCVAVGVAGGFIEPLEASALVMIELAAKMIGEQLPANREVMDIVAKRFNEKFSHRWQQIIDFLKLHYVLSKRSDSSYWLDNKNKAGIPESLQELISLWKYQVPGKYDSIQTEELFPPASFQYILYGMDFEAEYSFRSKRLDQGRLAEKLFGENAQHARQLLSILPTNRELIDAMRKFTS